MHRAMLTLCSLALTTALATGQTTVRRTPLQKTAVAMESPGTYQTGERLNPMTGKLEQYDPKPRVVVVDRHRGLVHLTWVDHDGKQKTIVYQRRDAIDIVVQCAVVDGRSEMFDYAYRLDILPSSGERLTSFVVQTFTNDATLVRQPHLHLGWMNARLFTVGRWASFAALDGYSPSPSPGSTFSVTLRSRMPPGLVECRVAGGPTATKGVGEEMPQELAAQIPGYETMPHGYTIGPDERLRVLSPAQRAAKLVEWLPEFERQGWMTPERRRHYETAARRGDVKGLAGLVDTDLRAEQITTEVRAIVLGLADLLGK